MAQAYTPGLKVSQRTRLRLRRVLPLEGDVLVKQGDQVNCRDVVARTSMPGDLMPINLAGQLGLTPAELPECMRKREGDPIHEGELLAETNGIFGFFKNHYRSRMTGTLETVSKVSGQVILRGAPQNVDVHAYLTGEVVEVLPGQGVVMEAEAAYIQGIFGIGGEAFGEIAVAVDRPDSPLEASQIHNEHRGKIVVGGGRMTAGAIAKAIEVGASAVVSGGIDDADLKNILGYDLGVAITGSEQIGLTLLITEGFGDIAMAARTFELFQSFNGQDAACNGATQIRAGVVRPEVVIPLSGPALDEPVTMAGQVQAGVLEPGANVRIIREPYFGYLGKVRDLPHEPQALDSGSKARVLTVGLDDGSVVTVPRANVELIEG